MAADYTPKQGQYLAFIYAYTTIHGYAPAENDFRRFFGRLTVRAAAATGCIVSRPGPATSRESEATAEGVRQPGDELRVAFE